jgi:hypothetical protein
MMKTGEFRKADHAEMMDAPKEVFGRNLTSAFANHFNVMINPVYTRIVFGEGFGSGTPADSTWHTAITMPSGDAKALAEVLTTLFADAEASWAGAAQAAQEAGKNGSEE